MKRTFSFVLALVMTLFCCNGLAVAAAASDVRSSPTISSYAVMLKAGSKRGELRISYDVTSSQPRADVGVSSIEIYKSDGTYVTTITGTTSNGLISNGTGSTSGTYSHIATSGVSYYAKVTIFAKANGVSDSRTVTTETVKTV